jgi:NAD(P)-dependent dehydrogenase (short-subunit alcohol dehydrogenase family)
LRSIIVSNEACPSQAASGIGKETALAFAEAGVEGVILADLNEPTKSIIDECRRFSKHPNFRVVPVQTDVADEDSVAQMVEIAVEEFGRIDYCVHSAGVSQPIFI